ncbi:hypothetical protein VPH35_102661 [Triticum aestivum]
MDSPAIPDEILVEIFLRIPASAGLLRASAPPHPSASAASAVALAADFSFAFLPGLACDYRVQDVRGGRVLLSRRPFDDRSLVVCDPLHRRYLMLPSISDALADSVENMLGSDTGQWRAVPSQSWNDLLVHSFEPTGIIIFNHRQYAHGRFYWIMKLKEGMKMLVLDTVRLEFSIIEPPPEAKGAHIPNMTMVETGEGMTGLFMLACGTSKLRYSIRRYNSGSSSQYSLISSLESSLFLYDDGSSSLDPGFFTLDIETFQLENVCTLDISDPHPYSNFPPSLSSPTI